jgi:hypothetical protein
MGRKQQYPPKKRLTTVSRAIATKTSPGMELFISAPADVTLSEPDSRGDLNSMAV